MDWVQPLELQNILIGIFAGDGVYFLGIALLVIFGLAAYFRMTTLVTGVMLGVFLLFFTPHGYFPSYLTTLLVIIAALLIGYWISRIGK